MSADNSMEFLSLKIVELIREGKFSVLRKYIPRTLFFDTNLPTVIIRIFDKDKQRYYFEEEHPELALSYLLPGRVTFRYDDIHGHIIQLEKGICSDFTTQILKQNYTIKSIDSHKGNYVEEYEYLLNKINVNLQPQQTLSKKSSTCKSTIPETFLLDRVSLRQNNTFTYYGIPKEYGVHSYSFNKKSTFPLFNYIDKSQPNKQLSIKKVHQLRAKTVSYPRMGVLPASYRGRPHNVRTSLPAKLRYAKLGQVIRYVYAIDVRISYRSFTQPSLHDLMIINCRDSEKCKYAGLINDVRILECDGRPCVLGYSIKDTYGLELEFTPIQGKYLRKLVEEFIECVKDKQKCIEDPFKLYISLSICHAFYDVLLHIMTEDLYVRSILSKRPELYSLAAMAEAVLIHRELKIGKSVCEEIIPESFSNALIKLKSLLIDGYKQFKKAYNTTYRKYSSDLLLTSLIIVGSSARIHIRNMHNLSDDEIECYVNAVIQRLQNLIEEYAFTSSYSRNDKGRWIVALLHLVLLHTLSHHIMKRISLTTRTSPEYLKEGLIYSNELSALIFEAVSGGLNTIEQALRDYWKIFDGNLSDLTQQGVEDLLLSLGDCAIGSPEDLVYLESLTGKAYDTIRLIISPQTREEYKKVKEAFESELERLAKMWNLNKDLLKNSVIELLKSADLFFLRFVDNDVIVLQYLSEYLKNYSKLSELNTLIERILVHSGRIRNKDILREISTLLRTCQSIDKDDKDKMSQVRRVVDIIKTVLSRLTLRTCNTACGMCYFSRVSCMFSDPNVQVKLLNRRLLKLYATLITEELGQYCKNNCIARAEFGGKEVCICPEGLEELMTMI
jgi:hypothetical protein